MLRAPTSKRSDRQRYYPQMEQLEDRCVPAAILYGATGGDTNSNLLLVNPSNGTTTVIGPIGFAVTGLAVHPTTGVLYGSTSRQSPNAPNHLIQINRATGAGTDIGAINVGNAQVAADIAFRNDGTLFGWAEPGSDDLVTLNLTTGAGTVVGNSGLNTFGAGLAFNNAGTLFFAGDGVDGDLRTVNPATGLSTLGPTLTGAPGASDGISALDVNPATGVMFGVALENSGANRAFLVTINTTTGAVASLGQSTNRLDAIAWFNDGNNAPVGPTARTFTMPAGGQTVPSSLGLLKGFSDLQGGPLTVRVLTQPAIGKLTVNKTTGTFTFQAPMTFRGTVVFTYRVADAEGNLSDLVTVTIRILQRGRQFGR